MANSSFVAQSRKALLRRGRSLLRQRADTPTNPATGEPDLLAGLSPTELHELEEIHAALERIERGIFGSCYTCGTALGREVLEALPWRRDCDQCDGLDDEAIIPTDLDPVAVHP